MFRWIIALALAGLLLGTFGCHRLRVRVEDDHDHHYRRHHDRHDRHHRRHRRHRHYPGCGHHHH